MINDKKMRPTIGAVPFAFPGYFLGDENALPKYRELIQWLRGLNCDVEMVDYAVTDTFTAREAGILFREREVDVLLVLYTTFVPDHFIVGLLDTCDVPVLIFALEREIDSISLVGAMLANPTLFDLDKKYSIAAGEIGDETVLRRIKVFASASFLKKKLTEMRAGYMGENPEIMFSMAADEYGLKKTFGVTVVPVRDFEYAETVDSVNGREAEEDWIGVQSRVGKVEVDPADGILASKSFIGIRKIVEERKLDAFSINCWTQLKSKVCLPIARLNDEGIGAGCEGDLHSTIVMRLLYLMSGRAPINGDFLRLLPDVNQIMFSHCGAGSFSMARSKESITLHSSIETRDGVGVFFPADQLGVVTAVNMMGSRENYRMTVLTGEVQPTDMWYEGNPMRIRFTMPVADILDQVVAAGAGHHWSIAYGDYGEELQLLCSFLGVTFRKFN